MNHDQIFEGCFIISDYNSLKQPLFGIVQNLTLAGEKTPEHARQYTIFFPELNESRDNIRLKSQVTEEAKLLSKEEALEILDIGIFSRALEIQEKKIQTTRIEVQIAELEKRKIYIQKFLLGLSKS